MAQAGAAEEFEMAMQGLPLPVEMGALAFHQTPLPAMITTEDGEVTGANVAAVALIDAGLLAIDAAGRLSLGQPRETQRLAAALQMADAERAVQRVAARTADGRARGLEVRPLSDGKFLLSIRTLVADRKPCLDALADVYGLTPAELRLLSKLVEGASTKAAADSLHISLNTVRTHIRSLLWKCAEPNLASLLCHMIEIC